MTAQVLFYRSSRQDFAGFGVFLDPVGAGIGLVLWLALFGGNAYTTFHFRPAACFVRLRHHGLAGK